VSGVDVGDGEVHGDDEEERDGGTHLAELAGTGVVTEQAVDLAAKGKECGTVAGRVARNGRLGHGGAAEGGNSIAGRIIDASQYE
jgi:hypothetical protein